MAELPVWKLAKLNNITECELDLNWVSRHYDLERNQISATMYLPTTSNKQDVTSRFLREV